MKRNLILVINPKLLDFNDFREIGERVIEKSNREILISILSYEDVIANHPSIDWRLPTLTVSLVNLRNNPPLRGNVFFNRQIDKLEQIEIMARAGIKVPRTELYDQAKIYNPDEWGDFVIVKSRKLEESSKGTTAYLVSTRFLSLPEDFDDPVKTILLSGNGTIQEFIPTGPHPTEHRATTFLGRVLYLKKANTTLTLPKLDPRSSQSFIADSKIKSKEMGIKREHQLLNDPEILAFAQKIAKAFPGIPLLGVDILKNEETSELWAIEVNPGGNVWHFSSPIGVRDVHPFISRNQLISYFGAWDIAAQVLIEKTLYYAK